MNRGRLGLCLVLLWATLLACCTPQVSPLPTSPTTVQGDNAQPILTVTGLSGSQALTLAQQGYQIDVVAADGSTVSLDSQRVMYNMDIIVANSMNDQELDVKSFPLRLVGAGLDKSEMVGQITKIIVHVPGPSTTAQPLPTPTVGPSKPLATPTGGGLFRITGKVQREVVVTAEDIRQSEVTVEGHHFSGSLGTYKGARLNELLQRVGPAADAQFMVLTSVDGGEARMPLALLAACPKCVVGLDENGQATAFMPEMDCYFWMRQLVELDIR